MSTNNTRLESFRTGRLIVGLVAILMGFQTLNNGNALYADQLDKLRETYLPHNKPNMSITGDMWITWSIFIGQII